MIKESYHLLDRNHDTKFEIDRTITLSKISIGYIRKIRKSYNPLKIN